MERTGCGSLGSCVRTRCAGTGNLSAALILPDVQGRHRTGHTQLMAAGKADALQVPGYARECRARRCEYVVPESQEIG